jgi:hypothetical protein
LGEEAIEEEGRRILLEKVGPNNNVSTIFGNQSI